MKEATGELNITVITVIAIAAVAALFYLFVWPMIQRQLVDNTCKSYDPTYGAKQGDKVEGTKTSNWQCCPNKGQGTPCVDVASVK